MKTLYITDLDGTLFNRQARLSPESCRILNGLLEQGLSFTYATARSFLTSSAITKELRLRLPVIAYNGAFLIDYHTGCILQGNYFGHDGAALLQDLLHHGVYPIVYAHIDGAERYSYVKALKNPGVEAFLKTRPQDPRENPVHDLEQLDRGSLFYIACVDEPEKLLPLYEKYRDQFYCVYQKELYTGYQWLELMPKNSTKASALRHLKNRLGCERVVVFGDGRNDIELFRMADECYAVANAVDDLKSIATGVIGSNEEDGVANWLAEHWKE